MNDQDIMAYSTINADDNEGDGAFSSGGAIMEALGESDPSFKKLNSPAKPVKKATK